MNAELVSTGLKCDNPKCDWVDTTVQFNDMDKWVNVACPKCGDNVLTREDFMNVKLMMAAADLLNTFSEEELLEINKDKTIDDFRNSSLLKDAKGIEDINIEDKVSITFDTHKEIKAVEIKKIAK